MKFFLISCSLLIIYACGDKSKTAKGNTFCKYMVYGQYEYKTKDKNVNIILRFYEENGEDRFTVCYEIGKEDYYDGNRIINGFRLSPVDRYEDDNYSEKEYFVLNSNDVKYNTPIEFVVKERDGLDSGKDTYFPGIENEKLKLKYLSDGTIELTYKSITNLLVAYFNTSKNENVDKVILKKTQGIQECWDYNPKISFDKFSQSEQSFVYHDLSEAENWELITKDEMLNYTFNYEAYFNWSELITSQLEKYGNVFLIDFNNDGEKDIAGYFKEKYSGNEEIYFKLFLNDGIRYNEITSFNLTANELAPIYFPSKLNGKNVLQVNYVNEEVTNYLYWDKLENKIEEYLTD